MFIQTVFTCTMNTLTFLLFAIFPLIVVYSSRFAGPFDIVISSMSECPAGLKDENLITANVRSKRLSRDKLVMSANATVLVQLDDKIDITVNVAKQTSQGWKDNFFILDLKKCCTILKTYIPAVEREMARQMKIKGCPIPVGNYTINLLLNIDLRMIPVFTYGKYRTRVYLLRGHSRILCIEVKAEVIPKKNG